MKIKTKFDLVRKIKHSKEGIPAMDIFIKAMLRAFGVHIFAFVSMSCSIMLSLLTNDIFFVLVKASAYFFCLFSSIWCI